MNNAGNIILNKIENANDIKNLSREELKLLPSEIRNFLISHVSKTGGHLASNLGAVELTMALHLCLDFPKDKIVWDVGHQSYTHKILTGRKEGFKTLRQFDGMSGFPKSSESETDCFNTGHSSTSISAAIGLAMARELDGTNEKICAVIGDGSLTGGMAYEALDQLSQLKSNLVVILNDNEMSIGKNVGGVSKNLNRIRVGQKYNDFKSNVEHAILNIPDVGEKMARGIKRSKDTIKNLLVPGMFFEELGITYVGPIDGHNVNELVSTLKDAFKLNRPIVVHVKTVKGKGYKLAEKHPEYFHGVEPFDVKTGRPLSSSKNTEVKSETNTEVFASKLIELAQKNEKIVAITAAMAKGTGIDKFQKLYPKRTFDVGIAEQHAVTFAAGIAKGGYIPVVAIYSSFLQRAYDQILHDVCLQKLHVIFAIDRSGLVGSDGETHQGIYDTAFLSSMPGLVILAPKNKNELRDALEYAVNYDGPVAIKYSRGKASECFESNEVASFETGASEIVQKPETMNADSKKLAIIFVGNMAETAKKLSDELEKEKNILPTIINARFVKPIDEKMLCWAADNYENVIIIEESIKNGSYGEVALGVIKSRSPKTGVMHFCLNDEIVRHGNVDLLRQEYGLSVEYMMSQINSNIN